MVTLGYTVGGVTRRVAFYARCDANGRVDMDGDFALVQDGVTHADGVGFDVTGEPFTVEFARLS